VAVGEKAGPVVIGPQKGSGRQAELVEAIGGWNGGHTFYDLEYTPFISPIGTARTGHRLLLDRGRLYNAWRRAPTKPAWPQVSDLFHNVTTFLHPADLSHGSAARCGGCRGGGLAGVAGCPRPDQPRSGPSTGGTSRNSGGSTWPRHLTELPEPMPWLLRSPSLAAAWSRVMARWALLPAAVLHSLGRMA